MHFLSDIFDVDYTCGEEYITPLLESSNPIFCDNVILWSIGKDHRVYIQKICKKLFSNSFQIKRLRSSTLMDNDIAPKGTEYYCIKISLWRVIASFQEPYIFSFHSQLIKYRR